MELSVLKKLLIRLYTEYVKRHIKRIIFALILSILVAGSTSAIAWLLDPAVKKIFIEKDRTLAWLIPLLIIFAFSTKGLSLYFARMNIIRVGQEVAGELQKKIAKNILTSDIKTLENRHSGKYISNVMFDAHQIQNLVSTGVLNIMKDAVFKGNSSTLGHNFFEDHEARFQLIDRSTCPTGIKHLDQKDVLNGGLGRGEIGVVVANTGVGKSHYLVSMGAEALRRGKNVVHYTFELTETAVGIRYDSNLCRIPSSNVIQNLKYVFLHKQLKYLYKINTIALIYWLLKKLTGFHHSTILASLFPANYHYE